MFSTRENDCEFWVYITSRKTSILFSCCYTIGMTSIAPPWQLVLKTGGKSDLERMWVQFLPKNPFLLLAFFSLNQASFSWRILLYLINLMNILPWYQIFRIMPIQKNKNMSSLREHSQHELSSLTRKTGFFPSGKVFLCLIAYSGTKLRMYVIVISLSEMFAY